ncbi:MAG: galactokinase [Anaerolinea sp.]|nr:galactokinase [Anaerolinea sp.]
MTLNTQNPADFSPDTTNFVGQTRSLNGQIFEPGKPIFINRAPGRLDLMGGNDDYTGGLVFETTIAEATFFAAQSRVDSHFVLHNPSVHDIGWQETIEFDLSDFTSQSGVRTLEQVRDWINRDPLKSWFAYIVGNLYFLKMHYPEKVTYGLNMYMDSNIPLGKGVSSSAALEVAAMKACAAAYNVEAKGIELAGWTQWVENAIAQSASGVMDQFAVIMGDENAFTPMLCQPCLPYPLVQLPQGLHIWGIDSGVRHSVAGIEYEAARAATFMGYQMICEWEDLPVTREQSGVLERYTDPRWQGYLARLTPSLFRAHYEDRLPARMLGGKFTEIFSEHFDPYTPIRHEVDYPVRSATRYAVEENQRVNLFYEILKSASSPVSDDTLNLLGELMYGAHTGYSDCGLGSTETDLLVKLVRAESGHDLFGAKITGGGAGGTVAVIGRSTPTAEAAFTRVATVYKKQTGIKPYIFNGSSQGADAFGILIL